MKLTCPTCLCDIELDIYQLAECPVCGHAGKWETIYNTDFTVERREFIWESYREI